MHFIAQNLCIIHDADGDYYPERPAPKTTPSIVACSSPGCRNVLAAGWKWDICPPCRAQHDRNALRKRRDSNVVGMKTHTSDRHLMCRAQMVSCAECRVIIKIPATAVQSDGTVPHALCASCQHKRVKAMYAQNALPSTARHVSQGGRHLPPQQPSLMDLDTPQFVAAIAESAAIFVHPANVSLLYPASGDARLQQRDSAPIPMYEAQPDFIPTPGALHYDLRGGIAVPHLKVTPGAVHPYIKVGSRVLLLEFLLNQCSFWTETSASRSSLSPWCPSWHQSPVRRCRWILRNCYPCPWSRNVRFPAEPKPRSASLRDIWLRLSPAARASLDRLQQMFTCYF